MVERGALALFTRVAVGAALFAALAATCPAAPLAEWAPLTGLSPQTQVRVLHLSRSRCLPDLEEIGFPVYPRAYVVAVDWGRVQPDCVLRDGWAELGSVTLVSADDEADVVAWYADRLLDTAQYPSAHGLLFIAAAIENFLWDRDYYKYPNVMVSRVSGEWDAAGYRTRIELNRPAPKPAATADNGP